jgi:hypothetical protein
MAADPSRVVVTTGATPDAVRVHHLDFPELGLPVAGGQETSLRVDDSENPQGNRPFRPDDGETDKS